MKLTGNIMAAAGRTGAGHGRGAALGAAGKQRVRLPKAGEIVAGKLRNSIVRGSLKEGDTLPPEHELLQLFGVSRPTLREAIRILESEQLLETTRGLHGGCRVLRPNMGVAARYFGNLLQARGIGLADAYRTRVLIEPPAVRILAETQNASAVSQLRECLDAVEASHEPVDNALAFSRFHQLIIEHSGIETLTLMMNMLSSILDRYLVAAATVIGRTDAAEAETRRACRARRMLVNLIEAGDADRAVDLWTRYLHDAMEQLDRWHPHAFIVDLLQNDS